MKLNGKNIFILFSVLFFVGLLVLADNRIKKEKKTERINNSSVECSFVNELLSVGFSEQEAIQNIGSCKDKKCPFHHTYKAKKDNKITICLSMN